MNGVIAVDLKSVPPPVMDAHNRTLLHIIAKFYEDPANQAAYTQWHIKKYGYPPEETFEGGTAE